MVSALTLSNYGNLPMPLVSQSSTQLPASRALWEN